VAAVRVPPGFALPRTNVLAARRDALARELRVTCAADRDALIRHVWRTAVPIPDVLVVARLEMVSGTTPPRLTVDGVQGDFAQAGHRGPLQGVRGGAGPAAGRFAQERHELAREARHRAADADAADIRASADAVHPTALRHVALDHWSPAAKFHEALR